MDAPSVILPSTVTETPSAKADTRARVESSGSLMPSSVTVTTKPPFTLKSTGTLPPTPEATPAEISDHSDSETSLAAQITAARTIGKAASGHRSVTPPDDHGTLFYEAPQLPGYLSEPNP